MDVKKKQKIINSIKEEIKQPTQREQRDRVVKMMVEKIESQNKMEVGKDRKYIDGSP
jgi:hypothetical protein